MAPAHIVNPCGRQRAGNVARVIDRRQRASVGIVEPGLQLQGRQQRRVGEARQANGQHQAKNAADDDLPRLEW